LFRGRAPAALGVPVASAARAAAAAILAAQRLQGKGQVALLPYQLPEVQAVAAVVGDDHVPVAQLDLVLLLAVVVRLVRDAEKARVRVGRQGEALEAGAALELEGRAQAAPQVDGRVVRALEPAAQRSARAEREFVARLEVEGIGVQRLVDLEPLRRDL